MVWVACMLDAAAQTLSVTANFDANALNPESALLEDLIDISTEHRSQVESLVLALANGDAEPSTF